MKAVPDTKKRVMRPSGNFLWVDYQDAQSRGRELLRSKQSFVRSRHHRLQREKQLQLSKGKNDDDILAEQSLLGPSLQAGVLDGAPALISSTAQNPNVYFQHCEYMSRMTK